MGRAWRYLVCLINRDGLPSSSFVLNVHPLCAVMWRLLVAIMALVNFSRAAPRICLCCLQQIRASLAARRTKEKGWRPGDNPRHDVSEKRGHACHAHTRALPALPPTCARTLHAASAQQRITYGACRQPAARCLLLHARTPSSPLLPRSHAPALPPCIT